MKRGGGSPWREQLARTRERLRRYEEANADPHLDVDLFLLLIAVCVLGVVMWNRPCAPHEDRPPTTQLARYEAAADLAMVDLNAAKDAMRELYGEGYPRAAHGLGCVLLELGDAEGALACLSELPPSDDLAMAFYALRRHDEAACVWTAVLTKKPRAVYHLAIALYELGHDATPLFAEAVCLAQIEVDRGGPMDDVTPWALRGLAECFNELEDLESARAADAQADALEEDFQHAEQAETSGR